jgi:hypothetical protein
MCTADPAAPPMVGYRPASVAGEHRSAPLVIDTSAFVWSPRQPVTVRLFRAHAPWTTVTFAVLRVGDERLSVPLDSARVLLGQVSALFDQDDEGQAS